MSQLSYDDPVIRSCVHRSCKIVSIHSSCNIVFMMAAMQCCHRGEDEFDQLVKIAKVLGSEGLHK